MFNITDNSEKYHVSMVANGHNRLDMELDTGSVVSIVDQETYRKKFSNCPLRWTKLKLQDYNKTPVAVLGVIETPVKYKFQTLTLPLVVVKGDKPNLLGRNWLFKLKLDWNEVVQHTWEVRGKVHAVDDPLSELEDILSRYEDTVFSEGIGTFKYFKAHIHVKSDAVPVFRKARPVPYALKAMVEEELENLERQGIIKKVESAEWAAPTVNVPKKNGVHIMQRLQGFR